MHAVWAHGHTRTSTLRFVGEGVIHETIDARAERPVALVLDRCRVQLPRFGAGRRECLGCDDWSAVCVGNRSRFETTE